MAVSTGFDGLEFFSVHSFFFSFGRLGLGWTKISGFLSPVFFIRVIVDAVLDDDCRPRLVYGMFYVSHHFADYFFHG